MGAYDLVIIGGAPGSGKSTVLNIVKERLGNPVIDFGWLRQFHLNNNWTDKSAKEESMAFENLVFITKNYIRHKYRNIIVEDLLYGNAIKLLKLFPKNRVLVVILTCNKHELAKRVGKARESGFDDVKKALEYNRKWKKARIKGAIRVDNSHNNPKKTADKILKILSQD